MKRFDDISDEMTSEEYLAMVKKSRYRKSGSKRVESKHVWVNYNDPSVIFAAKQNAIAASDQDEETIHFASMSEAVRYNQLRTLERAGVVSNIELQPKFVIVQYGDVRFYYKADFSYFLNGDEFVIEEVKSPKGTNWYVPNEASRLKMKMFEAWRIENKPQWSFVLVNGKTGYSEEFYKAKFA